MSRNGIIRVASVPRVLDSYASASRNFMAFDPSKQLCALACEHRPYDQLNAPLLLKGLMSVVGVEISSGGRGAVFTRLLH